MGIRFDEGSVSPFTVMADIADVFTNGTNEQHLFQGWRFLAAEVQGVGEIVRLPVTPPASLLAVLGAGQVAATPAEQAREVRFIGRGLGTGRKVTLSIYGIETPRIAENDFRFIPTTPGLLGEFRDHMLFYSTSGTAYITIAGESTNWYNYVNWQYNSHWETAQRA